MNWVLDLCLINNDTKYKKWGLNTPFPDHEFCGFNSCFGGWTDISITCEITMLKFIFKSNLLFVLRTLLF